MLEYYSLIKHLHLSSITLSILFFIARGVGMMAGADFLQKKLVKVLPHIVDTVLFISAVLLTIMLNQYPFVANWLTAKVIGLFFYIGFGTVALKRGNSKTIRMVAFVLALCSVAYILSVGITRNAIPWG